MDDGGFDARHVSAPSEADGRGEARVTTATEGMPADLREKCPEAGNLFLGDTDFAQCPANELVKLS